MMCRVSACVCVMSALYLVSGLSACRSELAKQLVAAGMECSFADGGVLKCCGGKVMVQKVSKDAPIEIHGARCEEYYQVRQILYAQFDFY